MTCDQTRNTINSCKADDTLFWNVKFQSFIPTCILCLVLLNDSYPSYTTGARERQMTVLSDSQLPLFGLVLQRPHHVLIRSGFLSTSSSTSVREQASLGPPVFCSTIHPVSSGSCFWDEAGTLNANCKGDIKRSAIWCRDLCAPNVAPDSTFISNLHVTGVVVDT